VYGEEVLRRRFKGIFRWVSVTTSSLDHPEKISEELKSLSRRTGIFLGTQKDIDRINQVLKALGHVPVDRAQALKDGGLYVIYPRPNGGYLMVLLGRDLKELQEAMVRLYLAEDLPSSGSIITSGR